MRHPTPPLSGPSCPHWQAAGELRLALPYCARCKRFQWPVRARCTHCLGALEWRQASGRGRIAAFSIVRRAVNRELEADAPYAVAFVALDEGVRLFTNLVGSPPQALRVGLRVRCRFEPALDPAVRVPVFELDETSP